MSSKKGELKDLFKTPPKIKKRQYASLDNKLKSQKQIDEDTMDMVIILYCFIFLFFLMFIMTIVYTDNIDKYGYKSKPEKYSLWESIKMKLFGIPKHSRQLPGNCYIKSKNKCDTQEKDNSNRKYLVLPMNSIQMQMPYKKHSFSKEVLKRTG